MTRKHPWALVVAFVLIVVMVAMVAMVAPIMTRKHPWALVVAFVVTWGAGRVASTGLLNQWALVLTLLNEPLGVLCKPLVHPVFAELGALVAFCILASCMACLDRWEVLARLDDWQPRLWALRVAICILATLVMA